MQPSEQKRRLLRCSLQRVCELLFAQMLTIYVSSNKNMIDATNRRSLASLARRLPSVHLGGMRLSIMTKSYVNITLPLLNGTNNIHWFKIQQREESLPHLIDCWWSRGV